MSVFHWLTARQWTIFKFIVSGGLTAIFDLALLHLLVKIFHIEHVQASVIAYIASLLLNFILQKFWSFDESDVSRIHIQGMQFALNGLINLGLNTLLMYAFIYHIGLPYIQSQIIILPIIALESFIVYKFVIFKSQKK